jgi:tRNA pseudouridine38-40 synthase
MKSRQFKLTVVYDGTAYGGWQRQPNAVTVQELLETVLEKVLGSRFSVHGSGRTDAGVHARAQVASCSLITHHQSPVLRRALNANLPDDIRVLRVQEVDAKFHARFSATGKEYRYQIDCGPVADPFLRRYAWHRPRPLNLPAMRRAARVLKGRHDFTALAASRVRRDAAVVCGNSERSPVRTISKLTVTQTGNRLTIAVSGNGFLYKMVRSIVGVLVKVGEGKLTPAELERLLAGKKRTALVETAPAKGLFLWKVVY